jgi:hypothetical protein
VDARQSPPVIPPLDLLPFEKSKPLVVKMSHGESASLRFWAHPRFGIGVALGTREADSGSITDLWFLDDGKVRAILPAHLAGATAELDKNQRRDLRLALSTYRKANKKKPNTRIELSFSKLTNRRNAGRPTESSRDQFERDLLFQIAEPEPQTDLESEVDVETELNLDSDKESETTQ